MKTNANLHKAKVKKNDEFYTQLNDISNEMKHYVEHFKNKVVFCNCDDPTCSNFWRYFHLNFEHLGLKKLISTHYDRDKATYKMEYSGGNDNDIELGTKTALEGNGDFRSQECLDLLNEANIVVTNPPFSLFREYVACLMQHNKPFLIIANKNAIHYKELFPLFCMNKMWIGATSMSTNLLFTVPKEEESRLLAESKNGYGYRMVKGVMYARVASFWLTNIDHKKRHEPLNLSKYYVEKDYPKYDNYDAINIDKVAMIPCDYNGIMGVPITFMDKYCMEQFELLDKISNATINGNAVYERLLIRRKFSP